MPSDQAIAREAAKIGIAHTGNIGGGEDSSLTRFLGRKLLSVYHPDNCSGQVCFGMTDLGIGETRILPKITASADQFQFIF